MHDTLSPTVVSISGVSASWVHERARLMSALALLLVMVCGPSWSAPDQTGADSSTEEPYPITIQATSPLPTAGSSGPPFVTTTGSPVKLEGRTLGLLKNIVVLDITAPKASPPQSDHLTVTAGLDGNFATTYVPKVSGRYQVVATAPDGVGHSEIAFYAENPFALSPDLANAPTQLVHNLEAMVASYIDKIEELPPSPSRIIVLDGFHKLQHDLPALEPPIQDTGKEGTGQITYDPPHRQRLIDEFQRIKHGVEVTQQELDDIRFAQLTCDNLEKVVDGMKLFGAMLDLVVNDLAGVVENVRKDILSTYAGSAAKFVTGSTYAAFIATEGVKNREMKATNKISFMNDIGTFGIQKLMGYFCQMYQGTIKGHMHAEFYENGEKWWEYDYDVDGIISLHYPKDAHGQTVALKGRVEGFGLNFKLWENALAVQAPELMSSTVKKSFHPMPDEFSASTAPALRALYDIEGSAAAGILVPNSFFIPIHGTANEDTLEFSLDAPSFDMNPKARVIVLYLPVLSLFPNVMVFPLAYKPARFMIEHAAPNGYKFSLTTTADKIIAEQHFENKKENEYAKGEYQMDIEACNPDCDTTLWQGLGK